MYRPEEREDEIKAATYHGMAVQETAPGWRAEIIFDFVIHTSREHHARNQ